MFWWCRLDHILLETTGLANPAPLASVLWLDEQLESSVVEAKNLLMQLQGHNDSSSFPEAFHQITFADVVILNKVDMVLSEGTDTLEGLEKEIQNINSISEIIRSVRCKVDLSKILDCRAYDSGYVAHSEALLNESKPLSADKIHDSGVGTLCIS
ncbi:hypothetical protein SAY87_005321 [Trapa incisa]|uniref:CobW/HypB/UreG nucleotide-binding domain-containing protein n=1 Tax=Trapa incisa TaxID=236973 RepID=A0AAN7Q6V0_9MYRT|nr:hypothetical protein SAY87_005321 [Trapa incisa]